MASKFPPTPAAVLEALQQQQQKPTEGSGPSAVRHSLRRRKISKTSKKGSISLPRQLIHQDAKQFSSHGKKDQQLEEKQPTYLRHN